MTKLLRRLLGKQKQRSFIQGAGSVLDLGAATGRSQVMIFHARPAEQSIKDAWKKAFDSIATEAGK